MKPIDQSTLERIDAYLLGHMPGEERLEFEKELQTNPALQSALEDQREVRHAIGYRQVQNTLTEIAEVSPKPSRQQRKIWPILAIAASIVLVMTVFLILPDKAPDTDIYAEFYSQDPGLPTLMGSQDAKYQFYEGMVQYKAGNYKEAIDRWTSLAPEAIGQDTISFYLSMAYLGLSHFSDAREALQNVTGTSFESKKQWYSAFIALRLDEQEKAIEILRSISANPGPYQQQAIDLLERLKAR